MEKYIDRVKTILTEEQTAIKATKESMNKLEAEYRAERVTGVVYTERRAELQKMIDALKLGAAEEIGKVEAEAVALPVTNAAKISAFSVFAETAAGAAKDPDGMTWALIADGKADPQI